MPKTAKMSFRIFRFCNLWNFGRSTFVFLTKFSKIAKLEKYRLSRGFSKKILDFLCWVLENTLIPDFESWMRWWHKRVYHMYSDVIFGWILWIWLSSWNFCLNILILFSQSLENVIFSFFKSSLENLPGVVVGLYSNKSSNYSAKSTIFC